ncbi:putative pentatricopeptide repeat-containing protein At1g74580 [Syzygium oleosum]|uniref:putative pentatricopeptide repeat-containing protein At1g74580 n=1 Tax=Syzygium oleosum TaxID=219896 RepID=UPI0024B8FFE3|nr:putative pentatricopeptide repeat-containing protein At1g74580 [Syzygium oleosum]
MISWGITGIYVKWSRNTVQGQWHQKDPLRAFELFDSVRKEDGFKRMLSTYSYMIEKLGFHGELEAMEYLLSEIRTNINAVYWKESVYIGAMRSRGRGCDHNVVAYCTVLGGFYEQNYRCEAYELFLEMLSLIIHPDIAIFHKLIHILCKNGDIQASEKLLANVLKTGSSPNLFTFNIFIPGLCRKGALVEAVRLESITAEGLTPQVVMYDTLTDGLCKNSRAVEAESFLSKMVNWGLDLDDYRYDTKINGYCKVGPTEIADKILNDAILEGFVPDHDQRLFPEGAYNGTEMSQNLVINGLCKMGCVSGAYDATTRGYIPDMFTFYTLADDCRKQLKLDGAARENVLYGVFPDVTTYNSLLNGLCNKASKFEHVMEIFDTMVGKQCNHKIIT